MNYRSAITILNAHADRLEAFADELHQQLKIRAAELRKAATIIDEVRQEVEGEPKEMAFIKGKGGEAPEGEGAGQGSIGATEQETKRGV